MYKFNLQHKKHKKNNFYLFIYFIFYLYLYFILYYFIIYLFYIHNILYKPIIFNFFSAFGKGNFS